MGYGIGLGDHYSRIFVGGALLCSCMDRNFIVGVCASVNFAYKKLVYVY